LFTSEDPYQLASDIEICSRRVQPLVPIFIAPCSLARRPSSSGSNTCPIPSMVPIVILGHRCHSCGHSSLAFFQIIFLALALHSSRMCCIDSTFLQVRHSCLCSSPRTFFHLSPIMKALCIVLYRNCCTRGLRIGRFPAAWFRLSVFKLSHMVHTSLLWWSSLVGCLAL
jgi:hypothetical protein